MQKRVIPIITLLLIAIIILAVNLMSSLTFPNAKIDLTEENLYTLSKGSKNILDSLDENIQAKFYFSKTAISTQPFLRTYSDRIMQLLKEYEVESGGRFKLQVIDPRPDTEEEEWAERYGLQAFPGGKNGEPIYLGMILVSESGTEEVIPVFTPDREDSIEYDISSLIYNVSNPEKKTIGILTTLDIMGSPQVGPLTMPDSARTKPWVLIEQLRNTYTIKEIDKEVEEIPDDIDLLMLVHPKGLAKTTLYAIDQYVLKGGKALVFIDPFCQVEQETMSEQMQANMQMMLQQNFTSNIPELLKAWSLEVMGGDAPTVVADPGLATRVQTGRSLEDIIIWLSLNPENLNKEEIITNKLENMLLVSAGGLKSATSSKDVQVIPLMLTTDEAGTMDATMLKFGIDPQNLRKNYKSGGSEIALGYKIIGSFNTAFAEGKPPSEKEEKDKTETPNAEHLSTSRTPSTVMIVADVDMLSDHYTVRKINFFGNELASALNDNLTFVANAVENLTGSQDLIALRSRGLSQRPFTRVQEIQRKAQQQWLQEEERLNQKLEEANRRLNELQRGSEEKRVLDQAFMDEVEKVRQERARTRQELRKVRRNLREDVERLGARIKFVNIALIPLMVTAIGITIAIIRSLRRRVES